MEADLSWARIKTVFHELIDLPEEERAARIAELDGEDPELARELASLLAAHARSTDPLAALSDAALSGSGTDPGDAVPTFASGSSVGRYRIERLLARGGMGEVYVARDEVLGIPVAVKTLLQIHAAHPAAVARFRREVVLARRVTHPNVCRIYDVGVHEVEGRTLPYLTMELVSGETLASLLGRRGRLAPSELLPLVRQMADALEAAHASGVVHRDFKSGNVLLEPAASGTRVVVTDFGLARALQEVGSEHASYTALAGTPAYMAPEQIEGGHVSPATDVYALGVVLYEALTGCPPFQGPTPIAAAMKRLIAAPPPIDVSGVDERWRTVVMRCLERDPLRRFARAPAVVSALSGGDAAGVVLTDTDLPVARTTFVGRTAELLGIRDLLGRSRLVSLVGPAGCGKTRLAVEALRHAEGFARCHFVDLSPLPRGAELPAVAAAVADCLRLREEPARPLLDTLVHALGEERRVILLDNGEHVRDGARELAESLLAGTSRMVVLVTSREPLGSELENVYRVEPLDLPGSGDPAAIERSDAVRLFLDRAMAARPGFQMTPGNREEVRALVTLLDGIPLALELAAASIKVMPPGEVVRRLQERFHLSASDASGTRREHRTLEAALDGSFTELSEAERALLSRLSLFAGGMSLQAAEDVCAAPPVLRDEVVELLVRLVDRSLMAYAERGGEAGYRLLEMVAAYGRARLQESGEEAAVRERHLRHYVAFVSRAREGLTGAAQGVWLDRLGVEQANLRAAMEASLSGPDGGAGGLAIATGMATFWEVRGHLSEGRARLAALLQSPAGRQRSPARAAALRAAGFLARRQGDKEAARALSQEALDVLREAAGDASSREVRGGVAAALHDLGSLAADRGDVREAGELFRQALEARRELGDGHGAATSLLSLGILAMEQGDRAAARAAYEESLELFRVAGDRRGIANALNNLAILAYVDGDFAGSRALHEEALLLRRELGERRGTAASLDNLGILATEAGDHGRARQMKEESLAIVRELGDEPGVVFALASLGDTARTEGDAAGARSRYAESLLRGRRHPRISVIALEGFGLLAMAERRFARAVRLLVAAYETRERLGSRTSGSGVEERRRQLASMKQELGSDVYERIAAEARAMAFEDAVKAALGDAD